MAGNNNSGRRALPATVHMLRGNPSKKSEAELAAAGMPMSPVVQAPECPDFLSDDAKAEWARIVDDLVDLGVVTEIDRAAFQCEWNDSNRERLRGWRKN